MSRLWCQPTMWMFGYVMVILFWKSFDFHDGASRLHDGLVDLVPGSENAGLTRDLRGVLLTRVTATLFVA